MKISAVPSGSAWWPTSKVRHTLRWVTLRASWISRRKRSIETASSHARAQRLERDGLADRLVVRLVDLADGARADEAHDAVARGDELAVGETLVERVMAAAASPPPPEGGRSFVLAPVIRASPESTMRAGARAVNDAAAGAVAQTRRPTMTSWNVRGDDLAVRSCGPVRRRRRRRRRARRARSVAQGGHHDLARRCPRDRRRRKGCGSSRGATRRRRDRRPCRRDRTVASKLASSGRELVAVWVQAVVGAAGRALPLELGAQARARNAGRRARATRRYRATSSSETPETGKSSQSWRTCDLRPTYSMGSPARASYLLAAGWNESCQPPDVSRSHKRSARHRREVGCAARALGRGQRRQERDPLAVGRLPAGDEEGVRRPAMQGDGLEELVPSALVADRRTRTRQRAGRRSPRARADTAGIGTSMSVRSPRSTTNGMETSARPAPRAVSR